MRINWRVRLNKKTFLILIIQAILVLIERTLAIFGVAIDLSDLGEKLKLVIEEAFVILGLLGIVVDPTTKGIDDSDRAMSYDEPN